MNEHEIHCSVCGTRGTVVQETNTSARDNFRCHSCRSMLRQRDVAQLILDEFGQGRFLDINSFVTSNIANSMAIYEVGIRGPIADRFSQLKGYQKSYYWEDLKPGEWRDNIQCQDIRNLTYADNSFDLIISFDVFEHIFDPFKAFCEVRRVLKPDGVHIFSMPIYYPIPDNTIVRAELVNNNIEYIESPRFHVAGDLSQTLVVRDWGLDIIDMHLKAGLNLSIVRRSSPHIIGLQNASFVARKKPRL